MDWTGTIIGDLLSLRGRLTLEGESASVSKTYDAIQLWLSTEIRRSIYSKTAKFFFIFITGILMNIIGYICSDIKCS